MTAAQPPAGGDAVPVISGYRLREQVGRGGVSSVWLAERLADALPVAIKLLSGELQQSQNFLARFIREEEIISHLDSPSVVRILDHGFSDAYVYIVMEYLAGDDLAHYIRLGLTPEQALAVVFRIALALRIVHRAGVVHRDIKPTNVMFRGDGTLVLVDFGFAKMLADDPGLTRQGQVLGTPQYMSPEQARGLLADERSDLYSVGVIFYEMLTKQKLFSGERTALLQSRAHAKVPVLPQAFAEFQILLARLLAPNPLQRFQSAEQLLEYLMRLWGVPQARLTPDTARA